MLNGELAHFGDEYRSEFGRIKKENEERELYLKMEADFNTPLSEKLAAMGIIEGDEPTTEESVGLSSRPGGR